MKGFKAMASTNTIIKTHSSILRTLTSTKISNRSDAREPPGRFPYKTKAIDGGGTIGGRDESERQRAESQWIVAARPLCHLQYPVAYLSRLQRILPAARWELRFKEANAARPPRGLHLRHVPLGARGPYCGSAIGRRAHASLLARILT